MYLIRNTTSKTVILSDLRATIGPYKILDLEKISDRVNIERSYCLQVALKKKNLQLVKKTAIPVQVISTIETIKQEFDEHKLKDMIRDVLNEKETENIEDSVSRALTKSVQPLIESIRDKIQSGPQPVHENKIETNIDPTKLAELQQAAIEKMSESIDDQRIKQGKKIRIKNLNPNQLADEL